MYQTDARVKMMRAHQRAAEAQTGQARLDAAKAHEVWSIASARYEGLLSNFR
jgi:hypothetical protein